MFRNKIGHIISTSSAVSGRERNLGQFAGLALDLNIPHNRLQKAAYQIGKWVQIVQPVSPEWLNLRVWDNHTTEVYQTGTNEDRIG